MQTEVTAAARRTPLLGRGQTWMTQQTRDGWIDAGLLFISILPLLLTTHLPLADLQNHLARQYVLRDWAHSPVLQAIYQIRWALVPNLALDLFVLVVRPVISLDTAVRLFCIATVALLFVGTMLVNRTLSGGTGRAYRVVPLLCYGGPFQMGFLSYCFGAGLALLWFGCYLRLRACPRPGVAALLVVWGFTTLACHMAAFGLFALSVGGCELAAAFAAVDGRLRHRWRLAAGGIIWGLVLPVGCLAGVLILFMLLGPPASHNAAVNAASAVVQFDVLRGKVRAVYAITGFSSPVLEGGLLILASAGLGVALAGGTLRFNAAGAVGVVVMLAAWLVLPDVAGGAAYIDYRIPWAVSFFALASLVPAGRQNGLRRALGFYGIALAAARIASICAFWLTWEPALAEIDRALGSLPLGTRLYVVEGELPGGRPFRQPELNQVASYVVARRYGFEPGMFVSFPGQILDFQPRYERMWTDAGFGGTLPSTLDRVPPDYDAVLVLLPSYARLSPDLPLRCVTHGQLFELYQVTRGQPPVHCGS